MENILEKISAVIKTVEYPEEMLLTKLESKLLHDLANSMIPVNNMHVSILANGNILEDATLE